MMMVCQALVIAVPLVVFSVKRIRLRALVSGSSSNFQLHQAPAGNPGFWV